VGLGLLNGERVRLGGLEGLDAGEGTVEGNEGEEEEADELGQKREDVEEEDWHGKDGDEFPSSGFDGRPKEAGNGYEEERKKKKKK